MDEATWPTPPTGLAAHAWACRWPRSGPAPPVPATRSPTRWWGPGQALRSLGSADAGDQLFVGGSSRMAAAFDAVDTVRSVLSILEQQLVVVTLLRDILDTGLTVAIGTEHGLEPLASCAIVVMPVSVDGEGPAPSASSARPG